MMPWDRRSVVIALLYPNSRDNLRITRIQVKRLDTPRRATGSCAQTRDADYPRWVRLARGVRRQRRPPGPRA